MVRVLQAWLLKRQRRCLRHFREASYELTCYLGAHDEVDLFAIDCETRLESRPHVENLRILLVGLDQHTGFVVSRNGRMSFVHSSYYPGAMKVVAQPLNETSPLTDSTYRAIGKLLSDEMLRRWLLGQTFPVTFR